MKRRAFISVYDKVGLIDFARNLTEKFEYEIVASGDTYELLKKADIPAQNLAEFAPIGSLMGQNFDALNSSVLSGVLANSSDTKELSEMEKMTIKPFDMVVVNLCPFDRLELDSTDVEDLLGKIDIAGITLLRAGAKNYKNVTVIMDKIDYYLAMNANEFGRLKLAAKAFAFV